MDFSSFFHNSIIEFERYYSSLHSEIPNVELSKYLYNYTANFSVNRGKRLRPLLCHLGYLIAGGKRSKYLSVAIAIEQFHTFALIHDDIEDEAHYRRSQLCLHRVVGDALAINVGDYEFNRVYKTIISDDTLDPKMKNRVLDELASMIDRTIEGQSLDIGWSKDRRYDISIEDYLNMAKLKTGHYTGGCPLALGAITAEATHQQVEALRSFGLVFGLAYQINNDIKNIDQTLIAESKDFQSDITEGKLTYLTTHALNSSGRRSELERILSLHTDDPAMLARAADVLDESESVKFAQDYVTESLTKASRELLITFTEENIYINALLYLVNRSLQ
jgi:geranylgeranyl diphosphate synthase type I